jgi:dephospho-CoA kinase
VRIGLTGGIGSGKSEVGRRLAALGAVVVDADAIAREVVAPGTPALDEIRAEFGDEVIRADGSLDRAGLAAIVFSDADCLAALNAITHPRIAERTAALIEAAPDGAVVVYDMPLLVENGLTDGWDLVVVVDCPDEVRLDRLVRLRGMDVADARARMAAQARRDERLAAADVVLDNSGTVADLDRQVDALWRRLTAHPDRDPAPGRA